MEKPLHTQAKITKKKPVKVVYIGTIKVNTSASNFRALVQQLTGQDPTPDKLDSTHVEPACSHDHWRGRTLRTRYPDFTVGYGKVEVRDEHTLVDMPNIGEPNFNFLLAQPCDNDFMHPMFEKFPGLLPSYLR